MFKYGTMCPRLRQGAKTFNLTKDKTMTKKIEKKLQEIINYVGDATHEVVAEKFDERCDDHSFKTEHVYGPYGDTEVEVCQFIDEEDETNFREESSKELTVDYIINELKENDYFRECLQDMIDYVCANRDLKL